jgi:hypothetical protein
MARPRQDQVTGVWWDNKNGTWFFTEQVAAQRNLVNRPAGTLKTKTVNVTREVTVDTYINNLFPAIEACWPAWDTGRKVRIQQDNTTPHPAPGKDDRIILALANMATHGWDVALVQQLPNSPNCNTLDLATFHAIQSLQYTTPSANIDELIANTLLAYQNLPLKVCQKVWTTAQMVMNEIILISSDNRYKIPQAKKDKIFTQLQCAIPYRLPRSAMTDNGKLDFGCIVSFMTQLGKYDCRVVIVVIQSSCPSLLSNCCVAHRRRLVVSLPSLLPYGHDRCCPHHLLRLCLKLIVT